MENLISNLFQKYGFNVFVLGALLYIMVSMRLNFKHIDKRFESVDKQFDELRSEIKDTRAELKADIADIRAELKDIRAGLKENTEQIADLRADLAFHEGVEAVYGAKLPHFKRRKKQQKETAAVE